MAGRPSDEQITLAQGALRKRATGGGALTQREERAIGRYRRWQEEEARSRNYNSIPKADWVAWSGLSPGTIHGQARELGFPWPFERTATIELPRVVAWLHGFLKANLRKLRPDGDGGMPAIERKRLADAKRSEFQLDQDMGLWLRRDLVHVGLARYQMLLRTAGEALERQFGPEARKILDDALDDRQRETDRLFDDGDDFGDGDDGP